MIAPRCVLAATVTGVSILGCSPALREPPPVAELATAAGATGSADTAESLRAAHAAFARRPDLEAVREAERKYLEAAQADPQAVDGLIGAVRAMLWEVEHSTDAADRARLATAAVDAAQWCLRRQPGSAACEYYFALALGVQARERPATAERGLHEMIAALERVLVSDPALDEAGPHRVLALVRIRAPGWPLGPGDSESGLEHARRAVELCPEYPPNRAALAEALAAVGRSEEAREAWREALAASRGWQDAGDPDAEAWVLAAERALAQ